MPTPIVVLSTADYDATVWTNKQHIASRLMATNPVYYVESLGLRRPSFSRADLKRIAQKMVGRRHPAAAVDRGDAARPVILTPRLIPFHQLGIVRRINRRLIAVQITRRLPKHYVLYTFSPIDYGLADRADRVVYHSVDLLHTLPGVPPEPLLDAERVLVRRADHVAASSSSVRQHLVDLGRADALLWENVADIDLYSSEWKDEREPSAVFCGNLTPTKVDFGLLTRLADSGVTVHVAGPIAIDGTTSPEVAKLLAHVNTRYHGNLSQRQLAELQGRATVGLIPYVINTYTAGVFPMKVYEYGASGLRTVSTALPSLSNGPVTGVTIAETESAFVDEVRAVIDLPPERLDLSAHSWEYRIGQILTLLGPSSVPADR